MAATTPDPPAPEDDLRVRPVLAGDAFAAMFLKWQDAVCASIQAGLETKTGCALVGVKRRGATLARRFRAELSDRGLKPLYGELDISLYRDDYHLRVARPRVLGSEIPFDVEGVKIVLVDDVLFTGRTVRAAIDQLLDFGRPRVIQLAALIDRGNRELPIAPDFVGHHLDTSADDRVRVMLSEFDGRDQVDLLVPDDASGEGSPS